MRSARKRIFQPKELRKIISVIRKRLKVDSAVQNDLFIFEIGSRTGLRCQEMSGLLWSDVREDYLDVRAGKGGKPRQILFGSKTKALFDELRDATSRRGGARKNMSRADRKYTVHAGALQHGSFWSKV